MICSWPQGALAPAVSLPATAAWRGNPSPGGSQGAADGPAQTVKIGTEVPGGQTANTGNREYRGNHEGQSGEL